MHEMKREITRKIANMQHPAKFVWLFQVVRLRLGKGKMGISNKNLTSEKLITILFSIDSPERAGVVGYEPCVALRG